MDTQRVDWHELTPSSQLKLAVAVTQERDDLRQLVGELLGMIDDHEQLATGHHPREWSAWLRKARTIMTPNVKVSGCPPHETNKEE